MKKYIVYAIIIGALGHTMLTNASQSLTNRTNVVLEQVGE